jgi:hypothetical protein
VTKCQETNTNVGDVDRVRSFALFRAYGCAAKNIERRVYVADYNLNREEEGIQNASKYFHGSQPRVCVGCDSQHCVITGRYVLGGTHPTG